MAPKPPKPPLPAGVAATPRKKERQLNAPGRESIQKALSDLTSKETTMEHFSEWIQEARRAHNDRGAAILIATNLETALDLALISKLQLGKKTSDLFSMNGPLSTFDLKIRMGFALRIYGIETRNTLDVVRWIRNAFAHAKVPIKFSDTAVANACSLLKIPTRMLPPIAVPKDGETQEKGAALRGRDLYERVCNDIGHNLYIWSLSRNEEIPTAEMREMGRATRGWVVMVTRESLP